MAASSGRGSRRKGGTGERELVGLLLPFGFACYKTERSGAGREKGDIAGLPGFHVEVKRHETLNWWTALRQAVAQCPPGDVPVVIARRNREPWVVAVPVAHASGRGLGEAVAVPKNSRNLFAATHEFGMVVALGGDDGDWLLCHLLPVGVSLLDPPLVDLRVEEPA